MSTKVLLPTKPPREWPVPDLLDAPMRALYPGVCGGPDRYLWGCGQSIDVGDAIDKSPLYGLRHHGIEVASVRWMHDRCPPSHYQATAGGAADARSWVIREPGLIGLFLIAYNQGGVLDGKLSESYHRTVHRLWGEDRLREDPTVFDLSPEELALASGA